MIQATLRKLGIAAYLGLPTIALLTAILTASPTGR